MTLKVCSCCKNEFDIEFFNKDKWQKDGHSCYCKDCFKLKRKAENERKKLRDQQKGLNSNTVYEVVKESRCSKCEIIKPSSEFNKDSSRVDGLNLYCKTCVKEVRSKSRDKSMQIPSWKIKKNLQIRLCGIINKLDVVKSERTMELVGCTPEELKIHIESQFTEGMTWDKYGKNGFHIDHIRPCASFDFSDPQQQKECFHYTNLRPLWASENGSKNSWYNNKFHRYADHSKEDRENK